MSAEVELRPLGAGDVDALHDFFTRVPDGDRTFFREDVLADGVIESWIEHAAGERVLAWRGDVVVGYLALLPGVGWSAHVGEIRLVIDAEHRRQGIGRDLARRAVVDAGSLGLTKLVVEIVAEQESTISMFTALGFEAEGLLRDHVRSRHGEQHDLLVLAHFVDELSTSMTSIGIDDAVSPNG